MTKYARSSIHKSSSNSWNMEFGKHLLVVKLEGPSLTPKLCSHLLNKSGP